MTIDLIQFADAFDELSRLIRSPPMDASKTRALVIASAVGGVRRLQGILGVNIDGIFGPASQTALHLVDIDKLVERILGPTYVHPVPVPPPVTVPTPAPIPSPTHMPVPADPPEPPQNPYAAEYERCYTTMIIHPDRMTEIQDIGRKIQQNMPTYKGVSNIIGLPYWPLIGIIHNLESSMNFTTHLYNGDSLDKRTVRVPVGRPTTGNPPFTWEFSALDCLVYEGFDRWHDWSIAGMAYILEKYNGFGYRIHGIPSPYLWSGSSIYTKGFYTSDGNFDPNAVSKQIGGMTMLKYLSTQGIGV